MAFEKFPNRSIPAGKLPAELLEQVFKIFPQPDQRVLVGPGVGVDCAVVEGSSKLWVIKSDPITFATDQLGWYLVQVNSNDIATTGALPQWLMVTLLLPEGSTTPSLVEDIARQVSDACRQIGVSVIGGHTEITGSVSRPIAIGTMLGEVDADHLIKACGSRAGDHVLLTKSVPIEATAILSREFSHELAGSLSPQEIVEAQNFLYRPGISVLRDARIALAAGQVTAMHDPTEGGLATALWELAAASQKTLRIELDRIRIHPISQKVCRHFNVDPLAAIASGALLLTAPASQAPAIMDGLRAAGIPCEDIGIVEAGPTQVWVKGSGVQDPVLLPRPERDEIARLYEMR